jgi:HK97 family phage prohead protease
MQLSEIAMIGTKEAVRGRETKRAPAAVTHVSAEGVFEGYASLFGVIDLGRDVVAAGAFRETLARRPLSSIKLLWQHETREPIGTWLAVAEDARGLKVRGRLNLAVARAREIFALMREGAVDGLSIGYTARQAKTDPRTGVRRLSAVDLWEISLVTFPMLPQARVTSVKRGVGAGEWRSALGRLRWRMAAMDVRARLGGFAHCANVRRKDDSAAGDEVGGGAGNGHWREQPRVPAGNSDGGQWTSEGGSAGFSEASYEGDVASFGDTVAPGTGVLAMTGDCAGESQYAIAQCENWLSLPDPPRRLTGGYKDAYNCARGLVSERCGGNKVKY